MKYSIFLFLLLALSCTQSVPPHSDPIWQKVNFKMDAPSLEKNRIQEYEFCCPNNEASKKAVLAADASVKFQGSAGRVGCEKTQLLCIGTVSAKHFERRLYNLCLLDFVKRIEPTYYE